ncbi:DUF4255 domain-containing protein [Desulfuribacillus alkaliarsenatis]|uniref:Pvc16 N-terminal domain-containing protein n=1 Tax=Desulfuribacillus alkaliarsenatis TaxID=766136 RepID=A0A1E5G2L2_9FIRM|nr:DUF4255 domain-containing protein [Desulfuribacillus alkaliarsenatis]OEF97127.1 hypothetical protein BHF68_05895 [Desulfuribacillus alkaliarsenatis]
MDSYEVIADVSRSLVELLRKNLTPEPVAKEELIGLCPPYEAGNYILGLHMYNIEEKKNMGTQRMLNISPGVQKDPPIPLMLYYMLTVYSKTELANRAIDEQRILGRAMQVFHDFSKLKGNPHIEISAIQMSMDDKAKIWSIFNQPYQLSLYYSVGPVYLESDIIRDTKPVVDFKVDIQSK